MSQRTQSIMFFLSALLFAVLFFIPLAEYFGELNILRFNVFGVESLMPDGAIPFGKMFALPVLILTVTAVLLGAYLSISLVKAVKMAQFQKLHSIALIDIVVVVAWIAVVYAYYIRAVGKPILAEPRFKVGVFLPLLALLLVMLGAGSLKKDIKKVRSMDRIR
ncbi:MAG: DUF4293 domain-containing protein [Bacteroidales bacterium]|nr:DUF4293 domain-containing protein [Bacteroidales bacterium]